MKDYIFAIFWFCLAGLSGAALYYTSEQTHITAKNIAEIRAATTETRHDIAVLSAEYWRLTAPARLEALAARLMPDLQPMTGEQLLPPRPAAKSAAAGKHPVVSSVKDLIDNLLETNDRTGLSDAQQQKAVLAQNASHTP